MTSCKQISTDLSNTQKCRQSDPVHKAKINDFDIKWTILMPTQ